MKSHISRRNRERKELRFKMLNAAARLFERGGESAVTLRGVAKIIEYSATTIYLLFPNKETLVQELCAAEFESFAHAIRQAEHVPDAIDRLRRVARLYADFGLQHPEHYRVLFLRESSRNAIIPAAPAFPVVAPEVPAKPIGVIGVVAEPKTAPHPYNQLHDAAFKAMAAGCFKPEYRDVAMVAQIVWSCLHGVVALHLVRTQHTGVPWKPVESLLDGSLEALFNGLTIPSCQLPPTWWK